MSQRHAGILTGAEVGVSAAAPVVLNQNTLPTTIVATPRKNDDNTRGGAYSYQSVTSNSQSSINNQATLLPWEECLFEVGVRNGETTSKSVYFLRTAGGALRIFSVQIETNGSITHWVGGSGIAFVNGTQVGTSTEIDLFPLSEFRWLGIHVRIAGGTDGFIRSFVEDVLKLDTSGINTQGNGATEAAVVMFTGQQTVNWDDIFVRPRCILIDAAAPITGTPSIGGTVTGAGATADVYGWEGTGSDSEGGTGDPNLSTTEFRLLLRNVSFGPEVKTGGFVNNESVTVTGLSGPTLNVNAPHAGYKQGLEPGSQFLGRGLYIERMTPDAVGTDNVDGSLVGGATDRADALAVADDAKRVEHTAAVEDVTVNCTSLTDQGTIAEIAGIQLYLRGSSDGAAPDSFQGRMYDNGVAIQKPIKNMLASGQTAVQVPFDRNAAGGQWATGAGAGGTDDAEAGYRTSTS